MIDKIAFGGRIKTSELPHFEITSLILKCCKSLLPEHQAQVINYLKAANIPVGLLVNFGHRNLEYKRLHHPLIHPADEGDLLDPVSSFVVPDF